MSLMLFCVSRKACVSLGLHVSFSAAAEENLNHIIVVESKEPLDQYDEKAGCATSLNLSAVSEAL